MVNTAAQIIALPQGGGATRGLGEKFAPDLHSGTGNTTIPIEIPAGRGGHQPRLDLVYSSGAGNGFLGLGWSLTVPGVARKTSHGVPRYDDRDTFLLAGAEDLVVVEALSPAEVRYRPRTDGLFARTTHHRDPDHWTVESVDGLVSRYATTLTDLANPGHVFAWKLTETVDPLGNLIVYEYDTDEGEGGGHRWRQPLLTAIRYADVDDGGTTRFVAAMRFEYSDREDAFSDYRAGFEIRTSLLCRSITTSTHADEDLLVRRYELDYDADAHNGAALLTSVRVTGFDDAGIPHRDLPPVRFGYTALDPEARRFEPVRGTDLPATSLGRPGCDVVDLTGDGLPDLLDWSGPDARWWRNLGAAGFDRPRTMPRTPAGVSLADHGAQLLDADGDGRADLLVTTPGQAWHVTLGFDGAWDKPRPYGSAPSFDLKDPNVRLTDLTGDGRTDVLRAGTRLECWFHEPDTGWRGPVPARIDDSAPPAFDDPRVRLADMTGDGLADLVLVHAGSVVYWPNLGHGRWGRLLRMAESPRLPDGYDPAQVLLGDVDGDGLADLVLVGDDTTVWFNRAGNGWSAPVTVRGTPRQGFSNHVRIVDLHGTGTGGIMFSRDNAGNGRPALFFLDLTGGVKPRMLHRMDNGIGAQTEVDYLPSTQFATRGWQTTLPIVVPVVARVTVRDRISDCTLVSEFRYHHGYWDGVEREFRGFGRVEQLDASTRAVPTRTITWFHVGAARPDWSGEYWPGDRNVLPASGGGPVRALRGRVLRTELYALDGTDRQDRPYTVTEHAYAVRSEAPGVFSCLTRGERTTQWERGDDPMTRFVWTGDHDEFGRAGRRTSVAPPRLAAHRRPWTAAVVGEVRPDHDRVLAVHTRTTYARPTGAAYIHDRVASVTTYELIDPPGTLRADEVDAVFTAADPAQTRVVGHVLNLYDGAAFTGLDCGRLGSHGLLTRTATLVHTTETLSPAYPIEGLDDLSGRLGLHRDPGGPGFLPGWYTDTVCQGYDVQLGVQPARGLALRIRDPLGHETTVVPDRFGLRTAEVIDPVGLSTLIEHDWRADQPARVTDANGIATHYGYHPLGLLAHSRLGGTAAEPDVRYEYDLTAFERAGEPIAVRTISRVWRVSDAVSDETIEMREYADGFARLVQTQRQADELVFQSWTGSGSSAGLRDPDRVVVSGWQIYDDKGRVVEKYEPFMASGWGLRSATEASGGRRVRLEYDPRGQLIGTISPDGSQRRTGYGMPSDHGIDIADTSPWVVTRWDEEDLGDGAHRGTPTVTLLDGFGRTTAVLTLGQDGHLVRTRHDIRGNVILQLDEHGREAQRFVYDLTNRALRTDHIDAGTRFCVYDAGGAPRRTWDSRGTETLRQYDDANRPTAVYARDAPGDSLTLRERITYGDQDLDRDAAIQHHRVGRLWRHHDEAGLQVAESYDLAGRLTAHTRQVISDDAIAAGWTANWSLADAESALEPVAHRTGSRYDALGRAVEITASGPAVTITPSYHRSGALRSVSVDGVPYLRLVAYNANGQRVLVGYGNGLFTRYAYDPATFRLTRMRTETASVSGDTWTGIGPVLQDLTYRYDLVGNVTAIEERTAGCGVANGPDGRDLLVREFGYDTFYRLILATGRACTAIGSLRPLDDEARCGSLPGSPSQANAPDITSGYREEFTYDPAGNLVDLLYRVTTGANRPSWHRAYEIESDTNRITGVRQGGNGTLVTVGHDAGGNLIGQADSRFCRWDHAGRLVGFAIRAGGATSVDARYLYAADGVRVKKWVRRGDSPTLDESTVWIGDGMAEQHSWTEGGGGHNSVLKVLLGDACVAAIRSGPARPRDATPEVTYTLTDHLGSASVTVDASGDWTVREEYFAFGETSFGGYARKRYRYGGMERDEESGLAHRRSRFYAPGLGRWISPDPAGTADGLNLYCYTRQNPISYVDPSGRETEKPDVSGTDGSPPQPDGKHKLGGNASYGEKVENRKDLGQNVQGDHPVRVELRKEQRTAPDGTEYYNRDVSKKVDPVIGREQVVLLETGKGKMHTEVGKEQVKIIEDIESGRLRNESDVLDRHLTAYEEAAKRTKSTYDPKALDKALLSNQAKTHVSTADTIEELKKLPAAPTTLKLEHAVEEINTKSFATKLGKAEIATAKRALSASLGYKVLKVVPVIGIYFGLQSMQDSWEAGDRLGATMDAIGFIPVAGDSLDLLRLFFESSPAY